MICKCNICNYSVNSKNHYEKHLLTKKHLENCNKHQYVQKPARDCTRLHESAQENEKNQKIINDNNLLNICEYCNSKYKQKSGLSGLSGLNRIEFFNNSINYF